MPRHHGGTDAEGLAECDFSTNSNALGPCPEVMEQIRNTDCSHYPDPDYQELRFVLATWHAVSSHRILLAASASEFIFRISQVSANYAPHLAEKPVQKTVWIPPHSYGDYVLAARAAGLRIVEDARCADLIWACEPSSPLGQNQDGLAGIIAAKTVAQQLVLDCAYDALRLDGHSSIDRRQRDLCWQLITPNKALGLTGIRGAYVIAPLQAESWHYELESRAASWPLGSHAVAMLMAWNTPSVQNWLVQSRAVLREWKLRQIALCLELGWQVLPSVCNFFCVSPPSDIQENRTDFLRAMRAQGIKLRHAGSFGLDTCFRMRVLPPAMQDAFYRAVKQYSPHL